MTVSRDRRPPSAKDQPADDRQPVQDAALSLWLRQVQSDFDKALTEPLPEELLRLVDARRLRG